MRLLQPFIYFSQWLSINYWKSHQIWTNSLNLPTLDIVRILSFFFKLQIEFEDMGHTGADHSRIFHFRAVVGDMSCEQGSGRTKKDAKKAAAVIALQSLGYQVSEGKS